MYVVKDNYLRNYKNVLCGDRCEDFIESLQAAIVRAGGVFINRTELEGMTVKELSATVANNNSIAAVFTAGKDSIRKSP